MDDPRGYAQVARDIRRQIESGDFSPGKPLPPIGDLCVRYGCSRRTVNRALNELAPEGLIARWPGLGWFVEDPLPPD